MVKEDVFQFCLIPQSPYSILLLRASDAFRVMWSPKCIDWEGLGRRRTAGAPHGLGGGDGWLRTPKNKIVYYAQILRTYVK